MKKQSKTKRNTSAKITISGSQTLPAIDGLTFNPNLPTHHADLVNMATNNEAVLLSFFARTPGFNMEECRVSISHHMAKKLVDLICNQFHYCPPQATNQPIDDK